MSLCHVDLHSFCRRKAGPCSSLSCTCSSPSRLVLSLFCAATAPPQCLPSGVKVTVSPLPILPGGAPEGQEPSPPPQCSPRGGPVTAGEHAGSQSPSPVLLSPGLAFFPLQKYVTDFLINQSFCRSKKLASHPLPL